MSSDLVRASLRLVVIATSSSLCACATLPARPASPVYRQTSTSALPNDPVPAPPPVDSQPPLPTGTAWRFEVKQTEQLEHAWAIFRRENGALVYEECCAASDHEPFHRVLDVSLDAEMPDGKLAITILVQCGNARESAKGELQFPDGCEIVTTRTVHSFRLKKEYKVLWSAEVAQRGQVVKELAFFARLSTEGNRIGLHEKEDLQKAMETFMADKSK